MPSGDVLAIDARTQHSLGTYCACPVAGDRLDKNPGIYVSVISITTPWGFGDKHGEFESRIHVTLLSLNQGGIPFLVLLQNDHLY